MAIQRAFEAGLVRRNGRVIAKSDVLAPGDTAGLLAFPRTCGPTDLTPNAIPLDILFEDRHLLALNKPRAWSCIPGAGTGADTLVHALLAHCAGQPERDRRGRAARASCTGSTGRPPG